MTQEVIIKGFKNLIQCGEQVSGTISEMCQPLETFGITYFYYMKIFKNGERIFLANKLDFLKFIVERDINVLKTPTLLSDQLKILAPSQTHKFIWTGLPKDEVHRILYDMDIWNGYSVYADQGDFIEIYGVGANRNNDNIINFYINNEEVIKHFVNFFKENFKNFISQITPEHMLRHSFEAQEKNEKSLEEPLKNFLNKTKPKKYILKEGVSISRREAETLFYLSMGLQSKEIARETNLSPRTIEYYLDNIKKKPLYIRNMI